MELVVVEKQSLPFPRVVRYGSTAKYGWRSRYRHYGSVNSTSAALFYNGTCLLGFFRSATSRRKDGDVSADILYNTMV